MVCTESDIIELIKNFALEDQLGKVIQSYSGYRIDDYQDITNIDSVIYHSGDTYLVNLSINGLKEYTYIPDMIARMRDLKINNILLFERVTLV